jgi:thymidine phosphorylase
LIEPFAAVEIISAKRDRNELTDTQIDWVISAYTRGVVADEQMSALLNGYFVKWHELSRNFPLDKCHDQ